MTREQWLTDASELIRPWLVFEGEPRLSVGFPATGGLRLKGSKTIGQCWGGAALTDGRSQIFISPLLESPVDVLAVLLHELIHHKVGVAAMHGKLFKHEMKHTGLEGKATATVPGSQCAAVLADMAVKLGPYGHARLDPKAAHRKQGTRLLKATCPACECTVRITRQWCGENGETLPHCGYCSVDGRPETLTRMKLA